MAYHPLSPSILTIASHPHLQPHTLSFSYSSQPKKLNFLQKYRFGIIDTFSIRGRFDDAKFGRYGESWVAWGAMDDCVWDGDVGVSDVAKFWVRR